MPPRRPPSSSNVNVLDLVLQLITAILGSGPGGTRRAASVRFGLLTLCMVLLSGWFLFQTPDRRREVARTVSNYQQQHKRIKLSEILWDIWTLYVHRPFVPTNVKPGEGIVFAGEPERTTFPHELRTLHNQAYTVGYCDDLCDPAWVCYRVFDLEKRVVPPKRPEGFFVDPRTAARVEPGDYTSSGYDRGHMAPNYAIGTRFGAQAQEETFFMSNVCPQRHRLNAGLWKDLETRIVDNYTGRYGQVWVIAGPVFAPEDRLQRLRGKVPIPPSFYMIVVHSHEGGVRAEAFIIDQEAPVHGSIDGYLTSVGEIEHRTGLNFFPKLERDAQARLEAQTNSSAW